MQMSQGCDLSNGRQLYETVALKQNATRSNYEKGLFVCIISKSTISTPRFLLTIRL